MPYQEPHEPYETVFHLPTDVAAADLWVPRTVVFVRIDRIHSWSDVVRGDKIMVLLDLIDCIL